MIIDNDNDDDYVYDNDNDDYDSDGYNIDGDDQDYDDGYSNFDGNKHGREQERGLTALKNVNAIDSFPQFFCICSFIKFKSFNNCQIMFIY